MSRKVIKCRYKMHQHKYGNDIMVRNFELAKKLEQQRGRQRQDD